MQKPIEQAAAPVTRAGWLKDIPWAQHTAPPGSPLAASHLLRTSSWSKSRAERLAWGPGQTKDRGPANSLCQDGALHVSTCLSAEQNLMAVTDQPRHGGARRHTLP